jgi:hypothetical protein
MCMARAPYALSLFVFLRAKLTMAYRSFLPSYCREWISGLLSSDLAGINHAATSAICATVHAPLHQLLHLPPPCVPMCAGNRLVAPSLAETSPPARCGHRCPSLSLCVWQVGSQGPLTAAQWSSGCTDPGTCSFFGSGGFLDFKKMNFQIYLNTSKNHNLLILAPKMMKPILVDFLGVDLQYKIIACRICDTFV